MGIFGNSSQFDQDVERATSENNTAEDWALIMELCDRVVGGGAISARDMLRAVLRRLGHTDPHVQLQAATLLDACVANCGRTFHLEVASRDFETEFRRLVGRAQPAVSTKLRKLLRKWAEGEFRNDPALDLIPSLSHKLPPDSDRSEPPRPQVSEAAAAAQREQDELARAIALSLKESAPSSPAPLYPRVDNTPAPAPAAAPPRKVRALYDFEAAEDNELTFLAGEIVEVLDSSDPNWWKGQNERGEGLFPANFVTSDLDAAPEPQPNATGGKSVSFADGGGTVAGFDDGVPLPGPGEIDAGAVDAALAMLHDADPERADNDPPALARLEARAIAAGATVDLSLERADRRHARLTQLSAELVDALNLYHELMRAPSHTSHHTHHPHQQHQQPPPPPPPPHPAYGLPTYPSHLQQPRC